MLFSSEASELLNILQQNVVKYQRLVLAFDVCYLTEIIDTQKFYVRFYSGCCTFQLKGAWSSRVTPLPGCSLHEMTGG